MLCSIQRDFPRAAFEAQGFSRYCTWAEIFSIFKKILLASNFYLIVTKTTNNHKRPQTITNHQETTTNHQQTTTNYQQTTTNHQQTTRNDQTDLFWIPIIQLFRKLEIRPSFTDVNEHWHLTSLCNLILYIPYAVHNILIYLFFK